MEDMMIGLVCRAFCKLCIGCRIVAQFSIPTTEEKNGVAE